VDSRLIAARMRALDAEVRYHEQDWENAQKGFETALRELDELGLKPEAWQVVRYLGGCAERLGLPKIDQQRLTREGARRLEELARSLPEEQMRVYLLNKWTVEERELAQEADRLQRAGDAVPRWRPSIRWVKFAQQAYRFLSRLDGYHLTRAQE